VVRVVLCHVDRLKQRAFTKKFCILHGMMTNEKILLIGDRQRDLQAAVMIARPGVPIVSVPSFFDGIAELANRNYSAVLAAAEPIERRPESAVKTLRELAGNGRLLLFGHPTLEPLSRKMLEFGIDDYLVTPAVPAELGQMLSSSSPRLVTSDTSADESADDSVSGISTGNQPSVLSLLHGIPLADVLLDALVQTPHDAPSAAVAQINAQIGPTMQLVYVPANGPIPNPTEGLVLLSNIVRSGNDDLGSIHLSLPMDEDETAARHVLSQLAHLIGKTAALQQRHNGLQKLAITDELTGLYNGRYFRHYLNRIIDKARSLRFPVTLFLFDIDNFKRYNDQYGHGVGDEILRQTAALMKRCVRDHDLVARISGDEFAVVFWEKEGPRQPREPNAGAPGRPPQTPVQILERFQRLLSTQTFNGLGPAGQGTLTISGGLAVYPYDANTVSDLMDAADKALMFKAKKSGKNSIFLVGSQPPGGDAPP
jgi:GGDEF domain-containing protein